MVRFFSASHDSAFTNTLPIWLTQSFRSPESYYPIFRSIANGSHRLSEIAKDIGFPYYKCGKYLEALIEKGYVFAKKTAGGKQSTYYLTNSYYAAWAKYAFGKRAFQVAMPGQLFACVMNTIDTDLALPSFWSACMKFIARAPKCHLLHYHAAIFKDTQTSFSIKTSSGQEVILDLCVQTDDATYVFLFPHSMDTRFTKDDIMALSDALKQKNLYYNTHITIFSIERFSDWCVHEAKMNPWLHEVTLERLKYRIFIQSSLSCSCIIGAGDI